MPAWGSWWAGGGERGADARAAADLAHPDGYGWAVGGLAFAATVMMIIGFFQIIAGLVAIIDD